ncbi:hypothetical protein BJX99DRAFT_235215 [Aspergillus californicus]
MELSREGSPPAELRRRQVLLDADEFVTKYKLDEMRDEIRTAAFLVDDPGNIECVEGLTDGDLRTLTLESRPTPIFSRTLINWFSAFPCVCTTGGVAW